MSDRRLAALLVGVALLMRVLLYAGTYVFGTDSANMLRMVDAFSEARFGTGLGITFHPMFPLLASILKPALGSERAGFWVSMLLGSAAAAPLYLVARDAFERPAALLGTLFYAFHPQLVELQADVMTEGTLIFFLVTAVWLAWETIKEPRWDLAILAGLAGAAAYLSRPEGMIALIGVPCWLLASAWRGRWALRLGTAGLAAAAGLLLAYPYLVWARSVTGRWTISVKQSIQVVEGAQDRAPESTEKSGQVKTRRPWHEIGRNLLKVSNFVGVPLFAAALFALRRRWAMLVTLSFPALYWLAILAATTRNPFTSYRYFLPGLALFLPFMALGLIRILHWLKRPNWLPWVAVVIVAGFSARSLRPLRYDERPLREVTAWIVSQNPRALVMSTSDKASYLAGSAFCSFPPTWEEFEKNAVPADFYVHTRKDLDEAVFKYLGRLREKFGEPRLFQGDTTWYVYRGLPIQETREHPRLLGPGLKALSKAKPEAYKEIKQSRGLLPDGIVRAVDGEDRSRDHIAAAMKNVARGATNLHQDTWIRLNDVALTCDLFHDAISAKDRAAMIDWMNSHLGVYTTDENAFHNSTLSKILCYLRIAYATWGENPKAKDFRDYALVKLYEGKVLPVLLEFGAGGGFTECGWYARGALWHLVQALELARRFEKYDGFAKARGFYYSRLAYEMHQPYPGLWMYGSERYPCEGDGSFVYGGHNEYPRHLRTVLAQYFRGSELSRAIANKRRKGSNPEARLVDFLYEEDPEPPLDLNSFPLAHLARGIGKVYARSDWTDDATWLRFECGDYWAGHQHFEVGNFEIFREEPLATESGEYEDYSSDHAMNWLVRSIAHNVILVHQPGETWANMRDGGRVKYANDGGQAKQWEWTADNLEEWKKKRDSFERGDIVAYENRGEFMFVAADCTRAYAPSKLSLWIRQIVFLRPHTIVIFDRVVSTKAEYAKTWLLHSKAAPDIAGNGFTVGALRGEVLIPENARFEKIEGYRYGGKTFDPPNNVQSDVAPKWRLEVRPDRAKTEDLFLVVLSTAELPRVTALANGVRIGKTDLVFDGRVGGTLTIAGKKFELKAGLRGAE